MPREKIRFAFTIAEGPNAGITCGGWRVSVHGEGTYISSTAVGGIWKTSLHGDAAWRLAVTKEHFASSTSVYNGPDRAPWKFQPTKFVSGKRLAYAIGVFRHALRPESIDPKEVQIAVNDSWNELTVAYIWMTEPGVELLSDRLVGGPLLLKSRRSVWVTAGVEEIGDMKPEPVARSTFAEPVSPEVNGVLAPGVLVRGVHVG